MVKYQQKLTGKTHWLVDGKNRSPALVADWPAWQRQRMVTSY